MCKLYQDLFVYNELLEMKDEINIYQKEYENKLKIVK